MTAYLLDTNVISELTRDAPHPQVIAFLTGQNDVWLSTMVIHELAYGLRLLPPGRRSDRLRAMYSGIVSEYEDRILPLDRTAAEWAARFRAQARRSGRVLDLGDALIAGTAKAHVISLATRNTADFAGLDVAVVNPWKMT
ncbi:MAG: PIN domain-containing protein [Bryobacterales bacterium]|nr:PIN domain-containing protein [Bryobacterales bacterium]MDE0295679.1 PIN domain-containing protein [Bryobacterales bacterium]